jgi:hypothetical protein
MNPLSLEDYTEREALKARVAQLEARVELALLALEDPARDWEELEPEARSAIRALKGEL